MSKKTPLFDCEKAVKEIKTAILKSRYVAAKLANRELLNLYFAVGRYVSENSRNGFWGTGAISSISKRLSQELPGLRGFSEGNIKKMRLFYEAWNPYFEIRSLAMNDLSENTHQSQWGLLVSKLQQNFQKNIKTFCRLRRN